MSPTNGVTTAFDDILGGWKTYLSAALGILFNVFSAFGIFEPTSEQTEAVNGVAVLLTAVFLRMGIKKAQKAATKAADSSAQAAALVTPSPRGPQI